MRFYEKKKRAKEAWQMIHTTTEDAWSLAAANDHRIPLRWRWPFCIGTQNFGI